MARIIGIVTTDKDLVAGGAPIFVAAAGEEFETLSTKLEKLMDAAAHRISDQVMILVDHSSGGN